MIRAGLALALGLLALGPAAAESDARPELRVLAAASLTDVVEALAARFEPARLRPSFGASSELARQAADGAPGDVFLSASPEWTAFLAEKQALAAPAVVFAGNALVCVAARDSALAQAAVADASALLRRTQPGDRIALGSPGVPAGDYARASLAQQGVLAELEPRLVGLQDVRAVLRAVETREAVAGFVYATDARAAQVALLFRVDPGSHAPIAYTAALLRQSERPELARRFLDFLRGDAARALLVGAGFSVP